MEKGRRKQIKQYSEQESDVGRTSEEEEGVDNNYCANTIIAKVILKKNLMQKN